jgi:hypothetical protein
MVCKMTVDDVHNNTPNGSEYGSLIHSCRTLHENHSDYVVGFTRRQAKDSIHALARVILSYVFCVTFDVTPITMSLFVALLER